MENSNISLNHNEEEINQKLITKNLTLNDLHNYLNLKFQDYRQAGQVANISECRVRQILIGYRIPKSAKLIRQIAHGWEIDEVKLAQLFERISYNQSEAIKELREVICPSNPHLQMCKEEQK
ncbi:MAG TPA: hypothetical protein P5277_04365 [Candidatus Paceibacterota bacterium]|nr:hypothetical protein [Candidatus Paceibacterota bacterium]